MRFGGTGVGNRIVVAGGGGGAASKFHVPSGLSIGGGGGGLTGTNGTAPTVTCTGGLGGDQQGKTGSGVLGAGSDGRRPPDGSGGGGGGGGGYYGGGGGHLVAGDGGGSGYGPSWAQSTNSVRLSNGRVEITPDNAPLLTLVKHVTNGATGGAATDRDFLLQATGPSGSGPNTIVGRTRDPAVTQRPVDPGTWTLSETPGVPGYQADASWFCYGASVVNGNQITLKAGDDAICSIGNTAIAPTITLVKNMIAGDAGSSRSPEDWTLSADGPRLLSGPTGSPQVTKVPVAVGTYTLRESGPGGYTASNWYCVGGNLDGNQLTVALGYNATCTITNTAIAPRLTLVKQVDNTAGGVAKPTDFTLSAVGLVSISGKTGDPSVTDVPVKVGTYRLSEDGPEGYASNGFSCDSGYQVGPFVTLTEEMTAPCTILNTAIGPPEPKLTLVKQVDNAAGGSAASTDWTLTASGPTTITGKTGDPAVTGATVQPGTYALSESGGPAGYVSTGWSCTGATVTGNTVQLGQHSDATCTIVNRAQPGRLTLRKVVEGGQRGTTHAPADWTLTATPQGISGQGSVSGNGADGVTNVSVHAGAYALSENGPSGFAAGGWSCTGGSVTGGTVTVALGADVTCSITNTAYQQTLTLVKQVVNGSSGGTAIPQDWTLTAVGPLTLTGTSGSTAVTAVPVPTGSYALSESGGPAGYAASAWSCTGAVLSGGAVSVVNGSDAVCTVTNTAQTPQLTLVAKVFDANNTQINPKAWTLQASGPVTIQGKTASASVTDIAVPAGTYQLSESGGSPHYNPGPWECTAGTVAGSALTLPVGADATCTITFRYG